MARSTPVFATADLMGTLAYYRDVLGFRTDWTWGEPPSFASASFDGVTIMFGLRPDLASRIYGHQHFLDVDRIDELYERHRANGAVIFFEIEDKPWGLREYTIEDFNGYHLRFTAPANPKPLPSASLPEGITFECRRPTADEILRVSEPPLPDRAEMEKVLALTWNGVVARNAAGETVGTLRIMWDAPSWYSIWDVAVAPAWQAQRIGSEMMKVALELIREVAPNSQVHLFTTKPGFYERLGFSEQTVTMRRV